MQREEFENLINRAVEALPEAIQKKINNVEIILEDGESPNNSMFGLYHGVSQLKRGGSYGIGQALPDKITIWKGTIEKFSGNDQAIANLIRRVVWHEIGHHFGFNEEEIQKLEEKWHRENKLQA